MSSKKLSNVMVPFYGFWFWNTLFGPFDMHLSLKYLILQLAWSFGGIPYLDNDDLGFLCRIMTNLTQFWLNVIRVPLSEWLPSWVLLSYFKFSVTAELIFLFIFHYIFSLWSFRLIWWKWTACVGAVTGSWICLWQLALFTINALCSISTAHVSLSPTPHDTSWLFQILSNSTLQDTLFYRKMWRHIRTTEPFKQLSQKSWEESCIITSTVDFWDLLGLIK